MQIVSTRSALLSNFEVLTLLRELDSEHVAAQKTAQRLKKEDGEAGRPGTSLPTPGSVPDNLRTIELEAIQYLAADWQPTGRQTAQGITKLTKDLVKYDLTKAEKLQVVNLAPTQDVELYVIVEEFEDRLGEGFHNVLEDVRGSLSDLPVATSTATWEEGVAPGADGLTDQDAEGEEEDGWTRDPDAMVFDDVGEGAGVEGDLDVEDD